MATKHKHRARLGAVGLLGQAQRRLEKGDFKQALKDAKVCYRQQPSPESRQFLERAYLARARQLHRAGLRTESQAIADPALASAAPPSHCRETGPTEKCGCGGPDPESLGKTPEGGSRRPLSGNGDAAA